MEYINSNVKARISFIDMTKGILIIMVMVGHMQNVCKELNVHDDVFVMLDHFEWFWGPFFMPAFFVITGFCGNFDKPFKPYLISNIKGLLIPAFTLGIISRWLSFLYISDITISNFFSLGLKGFITNGGSFWFLSALFVSKVLYFALRKIVSDMKWQFLILIIMHLVGFLLFSNSICKNVWFFQHSFMLTIYLFIGQYFKKIDLINTKKTMLLAGNWGGYLISVLIIMLLGYESPHIAHNVTLNKITILPHLFLSIWGSYLILSLTKKMRNISPLLFLGKNSLIFYCLHIKLLFYFIGIFSILLEQLIWLSILCWGIIILSIIGVCSLFSFLLNRKYFKFILGKF